MRVEMGVLVGALPYVPWKAAHLWPSPEFRHIDPEEANVAAMEQGLLACRQRTHIFHLQKRADLLAEIIARSVHLRGAHREAACHHALLPRERLDLAQRLLVRQAAIQSMSYRLLPDAREFTAIARFDRKHPVKHADDGALSEGAGARLG